MNDNVCKRCGTVFSEDEMVLDEMNYKDGEIKHIGRCPKCGCLFRVLNNTRDDVPQRAMKEIEYLRKRVDELTVVADHQFKELQKMRRE